MDGSQGLRREIDLTTVPRIAEIRRPLSPHLLAALWLVAVMVVSAMAPAAPDESVPFLMTALGWTASVGWLATMGAGLLGLGATRSLAIGTGGILIFGHAWCGFGGHLPMTSWQFLAQAAVLGGAMAASVARVNRPVAPDRA